MHISREKTDNKQPTIPENSKPKQASSVTAAQVPVDTITRTMQVVGAVAPWVALVLTHSFNNSFSTAAFLAGGAALIEAGRRIEQSGQPRSMFQTAVAIAYLGYGFYGAMGTAKLHDRSLSTIHELSATAMAHAQLGDREIVQGLLQKLYQCPQGQKLWDFLARRGIVSVVLGSKENVPHFGSYGSGTIVIDRNLSADQQLGYLLFELCNAYQSDDVAELNQALSNGEVGKGNYLRWVFELEHRSTQLHHRIAEACTKVQGWNPAVDMYKDYPKDLNVAWQAYTTSPYTEQHRLLNERHWTELFKERFCAKHPGHLDC